MILDFRAPGGKGEGEGCNLEKKSLISSALSPLELSPCI